MAGGAAHRIKWDDKKRYLARRFEGKIVVRAAQFQVIAKALAAPRLPDIKAHVTYRVAGMERRRTVSL